MMMKQSDVRRKISQTKQNKFPARANLASSFTFYSKQTSTDYWLFILRFNLNLQMSNHNRFNKCGKFFGIFRFFK